MNFDELFEAISTSLAGIMKARKSIDIFASNRAKFEGWLKVEVIEILSKHTPNAVPEKDRIDITFDDWALELKTCNTNYRYRGVVNKSRPITMNVDGIIDDIKSLEKTRYRRRAVLFVAFPLEHSKGAWQQHYDKISSNAKQVRHLQSSTSSGIPLVIYMAEA